MEWPSCVLHVDDGLSGGEFVCEERYVVGDVRGVGTVVGNGARVSQGRVVPVLLPWYIPGPSACLVSTLASVMLVSCRCVSLCLCLCVFGAFCLQG